MDGVSFFASPASRLLTVSAADAARSISAGRAAGRGGRTRAAVAAGIDCAVVHHPFTEPQDFSAATYRMRQLTELLQLLPV